MKGMRVILMTMELISQTKLKITLDPEDIGCFGLSADELDYDKLKVKKTIALLLRIAKEKTGFDISGYELKVSIYTVKDSAEIFITKLKKLNENETVSLSDTASDERCAVYSFTCISGLINACAFLSSRRITQSDLYYISNGTEYIYYLCVRYNTADYDYFAGEPYAVAAAYELSRDDKNCKKSAFLTYLHEHGIPIVMKNAVCDIANLKQM